MNAPTTIQAELPLVTLWRRADAAAEVCALASVTGEEYAAEETAAMNADARFWTALEARTGLTREQVEARL